MPTDIFPEIDIPVISRHLELHRPVAGGDGEAHRRPSTSARITTTVNDIEHIESPVADRRRRDQVFFQPGRQHRGGHGRRSRPSRRRCSAPCRRAPRRRSSSATAPRTCRSSSSRCSQRSLSEQQLFDYGTNFIRTQLATVQGAQMPLPYGGKQRQVMVDIDPDALYAKGLSPRDVVRGDQHPEPHPARRHRQDRATRVPVRAEQQPRASLESSTICPIKTVAARRSTSATSPTCATASPPQTNMVHVDGRRSALLSILKTASASTLDIVKQREGRAAPHPGHAAAGARRSAALRPVAVRARRGSTAWCDEAVIAAGLTGAHDPALPRQLAQHAHHRRLDPARRSWSRSSRCRAWARRST